MISNIPKEITIDNMRKAELKENVHVFSVDYNAIDINDVLHIHRFLMKETWYIIMFRFIKRCLLISLKNEKYH